MSASGRRIAWVAAVVFTGAQVFAQTAPSIAISTPAAVGKLELPPPKPTKPGDGKKEPWKPWQPTGKSITLGEALAIGQARQPAVLAATASLAAAERGYLALCGLRTAAELFSPDLPVRRQQSQRGLSAATAKVLKARAEATYDVSRMYYSYVYASQQEQTAADIVAQLEAFYDILLELLKQPAADPKMKVNELTLGTFDAVLAEVKELREKASDGRKKAYHALHEAMGLDGQCEYTPADKELPLMGGTVDMDSVVGAALARRPELVLSAVYVDACRLEVQAQEKLRMSRSARTFAGGTDLHADILPAPVRNGDYRPGAVPPEMPPEFAGKVEDRVARACEYARYADEVYRKSVGLVRLDSQNAFINWERAVRRVADTRAAHERAQKLVEAARKAVALTNNPEQLIQSESLASKAQARYVEAVYEHVLSLIALEKATSGGVVPAFPGR